MEDVRAYCGQCGKQLDGPAFMGWGSSDKPAPCPACGCASRTVRKVLPPARVPVVGDVTVHARREGTDLSVRRVAGPGAGRGASADVHNGKILDSAVRGRSTQGEANTLAVCRTLVTALNNAGARWGQPRNPRKGEAARWVDCLSEDVRDRTKRLTIQVVNACVRTGFHDELALKGVVRETGRPVSEAVTCLEEAIKHKEKDILKVDRAPLTLALDASWLPVLAVDSVVEQFRSQRSRWARQLGFESVWVVGSTVALTRRLDKGRLAS